MGKIKYFPYREKDELNGIFVYLNKHYEQEFTIEATTHTNLQHLTPYSITKRDNDENYNYWVSGENDEDMVFSFRHPVLIDAYTIENGGPQHSWMSNWSIFGSKNKNEWLKIDQQKGELFCDAKEVFYGKICDDTNGRSNKTYFIGSPSYFYHIKIENDWNSINGHYIIMRSLEFFGIIQFAPLGTIIQKKIALSFSLYLVFFLF